MKQTRISALLLLLTLMTVMVGCKSRLETGGAYAPGYTTYTTNEDSTVSANVVETSAPDKAFYEIDATFDLAYAVIDAAFKFELDNRTLLWQASPDIKHALDKIRPGALDVRNRYLAARRNYKANPTPAGLSDLQTYLSQISNLSASAQSVLPVRK